MTHKLADGTWLVLLFHSPQEWAAKTYDALIGFGCSPEYAARRRDLILTAAVDD